MSKFWSIFLTNFGLGAAAGAAFGAGLPFIGIGLAIAILGNAIRGME